MSSSICAAAALTMLIASILPGAAAEIRSTSTFGTACRETNEGENRKAVCAGPAEYSVMITMRNDVIRISFGRLSEATFHLEPEDSGLIWRGAAPFLGSRIEWQLLRGRPVTAIVRIFTVNPEGHPLQQFLIAKVTATGGCEIARIDASNPGAFRTARDIAASQVNNVMCELG